MGDPMGFHEKSKNVIHTIFCSDLRIQISFAAVNKTIGLLQSIFHIGKHQKFGLVTFCRLFWYLRLV